MKLQNPLKFKIIIHFLNFNFKLEYSDFIGYLYFNYYYYLHFRFKTIPLIIFFLIFFIVLMLPLIK